MTEGFFQLSGNAKCQRKHFNARFGSALNDCMSLDLGHSGVNDTFFHQSFQGPMVCFLRPFKA
jgi:hypothetical protein